MTRECTALSLPCCVCLCTLVQGYYNPAVAVWGGNLTEYGFRSVPSQATQCKIQRLLSYGCVCTSPRWEVRRDTWIDRVQSNTCANGYRSSPIYHIYLTWVIYVPSVFNLMASRLCLVCLKVGYKVGVIRLRC